MHGSKSKQTDGEIKPDQSAARGTESSGIRVSRIFTDFNLVSNENASDGSLYGKLSETLPAADDLMTNKFIHPPVNPQ